MTVPPSSGDRFLALETLSKDFGTSRAVDNITLDIRQNEFFALLGPSGCGKSTLLRMLAGFETPTKGRILLEGTDITPLKPERRPLNLMFQSYALFPHMTVAGNIAYGLEMERLPRHEIRSRVDEIIAVTDLTQFADRRPDQLSGGQRQRVALARALVKRPRVLLLDEPLGALDKKLREKMQLELKRLQHDVGITFVFVTHDQEEALVMADRMAILRDGKLLQCGSPEAIYQKPADRFVANFIGTMNFIPGRVDGNHRFTAPGITLPGVMNLVGDAVLAVRPEDVVLTTPEQGIDCRLRDIAYHGLDRVLHVTLTACNTPVQVRVPARGDTGLTIGDALNITFAADRCAFFPA